MIEQKIVTINVGIVGLDPHGSGTAVVELDMDADTPALGFALAHAYHQALALALRDLVPQVQAMSE